jgi:tRNA(Leu) C34 or U34 (ribose-2'-O)-methylase TrmL
VSRLKQNYATEGFFGIGVLHPEIEENIGSLWRSAYIMGASFIFTISSTKFKKQSSDVTHSWNKIPLYVHHTFEDFYQSLPYSTQLIGVEMAQHSTDLSKFQHPLRAVYLLGSESCGLPQNVIQRCHSIVSIPGNFSLNVAASGSIVIYDRISKIPSCMPNRS